MNPDVLERAQAGDPAAQTAVLEAVGPPLAGLVRRLSGANEADDCLQELMMHLLKVLPRFDPAGPARLSTWAFSVAHRAVFRVR